MTYDAAVAGEGDLKMKPKHRAQHQMHTTAPLFEWVPHTHSPDEPYVNLMDPLVRELFGLTELEFFAMFEMPTTPDKL